MEIGGSVVKSWSKSQPTIALSSGEAEYVSMVKGAVEGLGMQSLARDLGWEKNIVLWVDSAAAKSIASRKGVGRVRHLEVRHLWLQELVRYGKLVIEKVPGQQNPADILTKPQALRDIERLAALAGVRVERRDKDRAEA